MKQEILLSVIVPIYKVESYLKKCINSVLSQTFQFFELILVDDGSPDLCGVICDEYARKNPKVRVIHQQNAGVSAARNAGLASANGDYIAFIDPDDWLEADMYERLMYNIMENHADISICGYYIEIEGVQYSTRARKKQIILLGHDEAIRLMFEDRLFGWTVWDKIYRKELFQDVKWREGVFIGQDKLINANLFCLANSVVYDPSMKYHYVKRLGSTIQSPFNKKKSDQLIANEEIIYKEIVQRYPEIRNIAIWNFVRSLISIELDVIRNDCLLAAKYYGQIQKMIVETIPNFSYLITMLFFNRFLTMKYKIYFLLFILCPYRFYCVLNRHLMNPLRALKKRRFY